MKSAKVVTLLTIASLVIMAATQAQAAVVTYSLNNVILDDGNLPMTGEFTWTYTNGDFENGVGQFTSLDIPYTAHDQTDLNIVFDIGKSIEFTLPGNLHDDGVDITLFLVQPLTPTTPSAIDLARSRFDIGGNGFHAGFFLSGDIVVVPAPAAVGDHEVVAAPLTSLRAFPNPFNPSTTIAFDLPQTAEVSLRVYDMAGRSVRTMVDHVLLDAGPREFVWHGRDDAGLSAAAGIYFYRLDVGKNTATRRMTLVK